MGHIIDAAEEAVGYVTEVAYEDFLHNRVLQHAVIRCIEIVGEASARLSVALKNENATKPWIDIIGMRNRIVHAYFDIDIDIVWSTASEDLPALLSDFREIAEGLEIKKH